MSVTLDITKEQRIKLQKEMGLVCDQLVFSEMPEDPDLKVGDLGENMVIVMSKTISPS